MTLPAGLPIRVFLIDSHHIVLWGLERLLEIHGPGMKVIGGALGCNEALKLLGNIHADVILLELNLQEEDCINVIPQLIAKSGAKILVFTGSQNKELQDNAVLVGARGVLEKGAPVDTILTAINRVYEGQIWLDRAATGRIFLELSRKSADKKLDPERIKIASLTKRERAIITLTASNPGATAKSIAELLFITEHTLRNHLTSIYDKLDVANRFELFTYAQKHELISSPVERVAIMKGEGAENLVKGARARK